MKKAIVFLILTATLLGLLVGCKDADSGPALDSKQGTTASTSASTAPATSGLTGEEILANLDEMLIPVADQFQATRLSKTTLEDGVTYLPTVITFKPTGANYHLGIYCTKEGDVSSITFFTTRAPYADMNFALLSFYIHCSMNLPKIEAQDFYDTFDLLSKEPFGTLSVDGWLVIVDTMDEYLSTIWTFSSAT